MVYTRRGSKFSISFSIISTYYWNVRRTCGGASSDLQQVTNLARQMVTRFGMSNIGPIALEDDANGQVFLGGTINHDSEYAESIADRIDDEVCKIINYCEEKLFR